MDQLRTHEGKWNVSIPLDRDPTSFSLAWLCISAISPAMLFKRRMRQSQWEIQTSRQASWPTWTGVLAYVARNRRQIQSYRLVQRRASRTAQREFHEGRFG